MAGKHNGPRPSTTTISSQRRSLAAALQDDTRRAAIAADAVAQAEDAVRSRTGLSGVSAKLGLDTINRLRPGFLVRHVNAMLPELAQALEPHWSEGQTSSDAHAHFETQRDVVAEDLLSVADAYVGSASDATAIAVYERLRPYATSRVAEHMSRIVDFLERHDTA